MANRDSCALTADNVRLDSGLGCMDRWAEATPRHAVHTTPSASEARDGAQKVLPDALETQVLLCCSSLARVAPEW